MKVLSIVGARPQFIKVVLVSKKLREKEIEEVLVHTGQHYDFNMSDGFFKELNIPEPNYSLGIGSGLHGEQTGKMLIEIEKVLLKERPSMVLVYGDTNTTLSGALSASKLHIPVAHVEAGLRSFNKRMPEEINRVLTDHLSDILFAPTDTAVENLRREGITGSVYKVGDVMFDVAREVKKNANEREILKRYDLQFKHYILITIHRAENTNDKENLESIFCALREIAGSGIKVFFPVHPRTRKALENYDLLDEYLPSNLILNEPVSYKEMITLESNARVIITDSGGVQKEGYFFKVPSIIPRSETEWVELVEIDWNKVVGNKKEDIIKEVMRTYNDNISDKKWVDLYGSGKASERIAEVLKDYAKGIGNEFIFAFNH